MLRILTRGIFNIFFLSLLTGGGLSVLSVYALQTAPQMAGEQKLSLWDKPIPLCWKITAEIVFDVPAIANKQGFLFLALADGTVSAIDSSTGKPAWKSTLGGEIEALKIAGNGKILVVTRQEGEKDDKVSLVLSALSEESGITSWRRELDLSEKFYLLVRGEKLFFLRDSGEILAFNAATGETIWQSNAGGKIAGMPVLTEKELIVGLITAAAENKLAFIEQETGKIGQKFTSLTEPNGPMAVAGDQLIYSDKVGNIFSLRLLNGLPAWKARAGAEVVDISVTGQGVLVSSNDNFAYMLSTTGGDRKWKRKFSGRLAGAPVLNENHGLFITSAGTEAIVLNLSNGKFVNNVSLLDEAYFTGNSTGVLDGFALLTSQGALYYSPSCQKEISQKK